MARISTYALDAKPSLGDKVIGTEASGNSLTKNYSFTDIVELLNITNSTALADQMIYAFQWDISLGRDEGTISFISGGGNNTAFSAITTVLISKTLPGGMSVANYAGLFDNKTIILAEVGNINEYGTYTVTNIEEYEPEPAFFKLTLALSAHHGTIKKDKYYVFSEFVEAGADVDKHFTYVQGVPATVWNIQHNLYKFPSISVIDSGGTVVVGEYTYIDNNNVTLTFSAAFSGKAYLN